jgi:uncharacterized OB-fold protein
VTLAGAARTIPFREGVFTIPTEPGEAPQLYGVECPGCGARYAARREICLDCGHRGLSPRLLSPRGEVRTFTIVHQRPPGSTLEPPYAIVQVALADGPSVLSVLVDAAPAEARVGLPVEMTLVEVRRDERGDSVVAHAFRPLKEAL